MEKHDKSLFRDVYNLFIKYRDREYRGLSVFSFWDDMLSESAALW